MKKIILCGKSCTGKTTLKQQLTTLGYKPGVSYTTRKKRDGEIEGIDYHFIEEHKFVSDIYLFLEWDHIGDAYYGTSIEDFNNCDIFILTPKAIKNLSPKHRKDCLVVYLDAPLENRIQRAILRGDSYESIIDRLPKDCHTFHEFHEFDLRVELITKTAAEDFINLLGKKQ
jgi:guanylate kinase